MADFKETMSRILGDSSHDLDIRRDELDHVKVMIGRLHVTVREHEDEGFHASVASVESDDNLHAEDYYAETIEEMAALILRRLNRPRQRARQADAHDADHRLPRG